MADIKSPVNPLFLREEEIRQGIELLFYAYRGFTAEPDALLATLGLGRAHDRALYFVGRHPEITVSALLAILRITKQSLGRVLNDLVERGYVEQRQGQRDRRQRLLILTAKGGALERQLFESQRRLIGQAYRNAGADAVDGFRKVLDGLIALSEPADAAEEPEAPVPAPRVASR